MMEFAIFADAEDLSQNAARFFAERSHQALTERGRFTIALSGGSTPRRMFELLAVPPYSECVPWDRTIIFWGDDRAVSPAHEWSNYRMAREALLDHVPVPDTNIHRIKGELGAQAATEVLLRELVDVFGDEELPKFDLVLQGMGSDGHTASLFPGSPALSATEWVVPVAAPDMDPVVERVTFTFPVFNAARCALFLATGASKRDILNQIMTDPESAWQYPAARLGAEETIWYLDREIFGQ